MKLTTDKRILAIDLHTGSFGFAVLEGPSELLHWGATSFQPRRSVEKKTKEALAPLLDDYRPQAVVMGQARAAKLGRLAGGITDMAKSKRIAVTLVSQTDLRESFPDCNQNKHRIATAVASHYPEISTLLRPKRKPWQSERYAMSMFEAVALGEAFFKNKPRPPNTVPPA
jgi:RNase H-fold protein (predicted Holliday junction resolvase)